MKQSLATVKITHGKEGDYRVINAVDFDPKTHKRFEDADVETTESSTTRKPLTPAPAGPKGDPLTTKQSEELTADPSGVKVPEGEITPDDLEQIKGIGPATAEKLAETITSFKELAEADVATLALVTGVPETVADGWRAQAKALINPEG